MTSEISINFFTFGEAIDILENNVNSLTTCQLELPAYEGVSIVQDAFTKQIIRIQQAISLYKESLLKDVESYRKIQTVIEETDEYTASSLLGALSKGIDRATESRKKVTAV